MRNIFPEYTYIGFDISKDMLGIARERLPNDVLLFDDWSKLTECILNARIAVVCNSIIHEVYSYGNDREIDEFWKRIFSSNFSYVIIRDMMVSETSIKQSDVLNVIKIKKNFDMDKLKQFEKKMGRY